MRSKREQQMQIIFKQGHTHRVGLKSTAIASAAAAICSVASAQTFTNPDSVQFVTGRVLVMPQAGLPDASVAKLLGGVGAGNARRVGRTELRIVEVPPGLERQMVGRLSNHPHFKFAELDRIVPHSYVSNDPYLGSEWHISKIGASTAWDLAKGDGVIVAILDTGVDGTHPDLSARMVSGWNVYDNNSNTADVYGHGTKVAGSAAAALDNGVGVAGVAGNSKIMPIRISDASGYATYSAMASGLTWAADRGARVANISYVAAGSSSVISAANYFKSKGGLVTTSAGNYGTDANIAPTTSMIPVSATGSGDALASWSSYGAFVAMSAPGEGIYTTTNGGGYGSVSGTSFSGPVTAGAIALVMSANPKLTNADVEKLVYSTAVDLGASGRDSYYGYGRINAAAAVQAAVTTTVTTSDTTPPTASISAPLNNGTVSGLVSVNVNASDNVGVTKVELAVNGTLLATDTGSPYGFSWDSTKLANGTANLVATAYDAVGNRASSSVVSVNVSNVMASDTIAPTVSIAAPLSGSTVSGTVSVSANASDNVGVAKVELSVNGAVLATDSVSPYSFSWDSTKAANGTSNLVATAYDAAGNKATSSVVSVNVYNSGGSPGTGSDTIAPTVTITNPANGAKVTGNVGIQVSGSDNAGVPGLTITLRINGATVANSTGSSKLKYGWQTRNAPAGANLIEAIARDAAGNTSVQSVTVYR
jgi:subtilisin family serine protease